MTNKNNLKLNRWSHVGETSDGKDVEFMKISKGPSENQLSYVLYTPVNEDLKVYFPIVQLVVMTIPNSKISIENQDPEDVINDLALDAIMEMNNTGTIFNTRSENEAKVVITTLGIHESLFM